ncbi:MAG: serine hydrolase domain-containing protein [Pseudomonadales bacterium]|mgnify:CR=1 FL=1|jgi:CubicO group peptidase (beta-lactamase class C family)|nr:serine hydrolase domain-containing protein [Pseudomonadales bacterium]MDP6472372.1 serine hydrolase domain-containing protein [Pseudomonadales bacterium]MDP6828168.1 serine hydrolase domain-containing protein [Pseudomonadales bacterium]MDP6970246.1 serine hydrolase domain-containing protein [Pseudomonadales bacterium]|tara:strand:- start:278 stop:1645 length:1368 start_codon:yes stop_codon:yes gene_type:complete
MRKVVIQLVGALLALSIVTLSQAAVARDLPRTKPEREGMSSQRLVRLTEHMGQAVDGGVMVGGQAMIARGGRVVYEQVWGQADREAAKPMTSDTIFRIYSMSKPITSVAVMMLYEEGRFFLNDPVARYLPAVANLEVAVSTADGVTRAESDGTTSRTIGSGDAAWEGERRKAKRQPTVRDLLRHTAGMTYGYFGNTEVDRMYRSVDLMPSDTTLSDFITRLGELPLQYDPGTRWHYSVAVDVQGALVEAISGMRFGEFLERRLFGPLGMVDTSFIIADDKRHRLAQMYSPADAREDTSVFLAPSKSKQLKVAPPIVSKGYLPGATFEGGGGGLLSTAEDYLRFSQMLLNGGELDGVRILSPKTVELMTTDHMKGVGREFGRGGYGFGLGFAVMESPGESGEVGSAGEFNWGGAAGTRFWIDPQEQLIGIFMVQSIPHRTRLGSEFKVLTYQAITD